MANETKMTRARFLNRVSNLLAHFEEDHEEHTGITDTDEMTFLDWLLEINAAHDNS